MEMNDLIAIKQMLGNDDGLSDYESAMLANKQSNRANGATVAAITIGSAGLLAGIGAWIFGGVYSAGRARANEALIASNASHAREMESLLATTIANERAERVNFTNNQNPSLKDYINVTQSGNQSASSNSSALAQAEATLLVNALTGQSQRCPTPVAIYQPPIPCGCASPVGCGCNS